MKTLHASRLAGMTLIAVAMLSACGGDAAPGGDGAATMSAGEDLAPVAGTPEAPTGPIRVEFEPIGDFLAEGGLTLRRDGATITADILADSHLGPGDYPIHIHEGTCEEGGRVVVPLTTMTGGEGGEGVSLTTFPAEQLPLTGTYFAQMHQADGTPIACVDLPPLTNL